MEPSGGESRNTIRSPETSSDSEGVPIRPSTSAQSSAVPRLGRLCRGRPDCGMECPGVRVGMDGSRASGGTRSWRARSVDPETHMRQRRCHRGSVGLRPNPPISDRQNPNPHGCVRRGELLKPWRRAWRDAVRRRTVP